MVVDVCFWVIVMDGVFLMDGYIVLFVEICDFVEWYDVFVFVDDLYVVGFVGENGCGMLELCGVVDCVDIYIGIFGKVLGGVFGGYVVLYVEIVCFLW